MVTVKTEVPDVLIELALRVEERPFTSVIPSNVMFAVLVKFSGVSVKLNVADLLAVTVSAALSTVNQKSVPTGVKLHAFPTPLEGCLKLELESCSVALLKAVKSSLLPFFGVGTTNGVVEFCEFHQVLLDDLNVV